MNTGKQLLQAGKPKKERYSRDLLKENAELYSIMLPTLILVEV